MRGGRRLVRARRALVVLLVVPVLAACAGLPESGPVVEADADSQAADAEAFDLTALPPVSGASPVEIVRGFLDAMTASPLRVDVARQYLAATAAQEWAPETTTITYADKLPPQQESSLRVSVRLAEAELLDRAGAWRGRLPAPRQTLRFDLTVENGEYRIVNPPNALVVPDAWFAQRFQQASLYFFDPSGSVLVPEPVYVPRGDQRATSLISGLLAGPGSALADVVSTAIPAGLSQGLSVPVSADGVADLSLAGPAVPPNQSTVDRMLAQLVWTLRQDPRIKALQLTIGDQVVRDASGATAFPVAESGRYVPAGIGGPGDLYGLARGRLVLLPGGQPEPRPTSGPFGAGRAGLRDVAVDLDGVRAAGVGVAGDRVLVAGVGRPIDVTGGGDGATPPGAADPGDEVVPVLTGGTDLLAPVWDAMGRVWVVDRTAAGAVVWCIVPDPSGVPRRVRRVEVPGVTAAEVVRFLVSPDGTRFVAVVRGEDSDRIRAGRVEVDQRGRIASVTPTVEIDTGRATLRRIVDVAWHSATTIAVLAPVVPAEVVEVHTVSVDGAPAGIDSLAATVSRPLTGLAGGVALGQPTWGLTRTGSVDLATSRELSFGVLVTAVAYRGG
ncbi:GerMN domain-containing protein [Nocardioides sp. R-C-SC26]|uniref:GerMN domain-containing protein n=1 Tax=Nocardioides sp. R-C-SC26 TaxID=2870414 RepID=UPI001E4302C7|nr:GerMN domain-containing protein [Nocardioides sp. R-C-SC26]